MLPSLVFSREWDRTHTGWCATLRRWMVIGLGPLALSACATTSEPKIIVKEVRVPVAVPCPIDTTEPEWVDTLEALKAAADKGSDAVVALLLGGREQRIAWGEGVKKQAGECGG